MNRPSRAAIPLAKLRASLVAAGLLIGAASAQAVPIGAFEGPADNAVITGLVDVWGWAADATSEIDSVVCWSMG